MNSEFKPTGPLLTPAGCSNKLLKSFSCHVSFQLCSGSPLSSCFHSRSNYVLSPLSIERELYMAPLVRRGPRPFSSTADPPGRRTVTKEKTIVSPDDEASGRPRAAGYRPEPRPLAWCAHNPPTRPEAIRQILDKELPAMTQHSNPHHGAKQ